MMHLLIVPKPTKEGTCRVTCPFILSWFIGRQCILNAARETNRADSAIRPTKKCPGPCLVKVGG